MTSLAPAMKKPCEECGLVLMQAGVGAYMSCCVNTAEPSSSNMLTEPWRTPILELGGYNSNSVNVRVADIGRLHHIVLVMTGGGRSDSMCSITPGQRFFSSGNERMVIPYTDFEKKQVNSVYPIKKTDTISMQ